MADFMQMVYIKHLNLYNRLNRIDHNFWFTTFDIMAGLAALYIGCQFLWKERRNIRQLFIGYAINKQQQQKKIRYQVVIIQWITFIMLYLLMVKML